MSAFPPDFTEMHQNFHQRIEEKIEEAMSKGTPEELDKMFEGLDALRSFLVAAKQ